MKLNKDLQTSEERLEEVNRWLESNPEPNELELDWLATYLTYPLDKEERRKERQILTQNRMVTIKQYESSYEGLAAKFEAGDDALEAISQSRPPIRTNIRPKKRAITQRELDNFPPLKSVRDSALEWNRIAKTATGSKAWIASRAYRDDMALLYELRDSFIPIIGASAATGFTSYEPEYYCDEWVEPDGAIRYKGFSLLAPDLNAVLLKYYIKFKGKNWGKFNDLYFLITDFEKFLYEALKNNELYTLIVEAKWSNCSNEEIAAEMLQQFGKTITSEQISTIFCKKIPKLIAEVYYEHFLNWWYLEKEKGTYKTCSKCGRILLAHPHYFNKNPSSRDGFYSQCKECRSQGRRKK